MNVEVIERPAMKAAVIKIDCSGDEVRRAWKELHSMLEDSHWVNKQYGFVFVPEWQWATGVKNLWVGVEVKSFDFIPEGVEAFVFPAKKYARISVNGDRKQMDHSYNELSRWFKESGLKRDTAEGSFSMEANRLIPVNPFDIPADVIRHFDFDVYAPIAAD